MLMNNHGGRVRGSASNLQGFLKMLTHLWEYLYDIISNSLYMFTLHVNSFLDASTGD